MSKKRRRRQSIVDWSKSYFLTPAQAADRYSQPNTEYLNDIEDQKKRRRAADRGRIE